MTNNDAVNALKPYLNRMEPYPSTYLVDRLAALIGQDKIVYGDSTLRGSDTRQLPEGRLVIYTEELLYVQDVTAGDPSNLKLQVVSRSALQRLDVIQDVQPEKQTGEAYTGWEWPWVGQVSAVYEGLDAPIALPSAPGYQASVEPFRDFLSELVGDLKR